MDLTNLGQLFHPPLGVDGGAKLKPKSPKKHKMLPLRPICRYDCKGLRCTPFVLDPQGFNSMWLCHLEIFSTFQTLKINGMTFSGFQTPCDPTGMSP